LSIGDFFQLMGKVRTLLGYRRGLPEGLIKEFRGRIEQLADT
jgi:hypothetical protein